MSQEGVARRLSRPMTMGHGEGGDVWLTEGYTKFALFPDGGRLSKGIHHFGFALTESEKPAIYE